MKWRVIMQAVLVLCAGTAWGQDDAAARIAERLKVPLATVPQLEDAPAMGAALDFTNWAGPLTFQNLSGFGQKPPVETRGYLARDARHIYMAIRCEDPAAREIASAPVPLDGDIWAGDCAEFMLLPGHDPEQSYYHFAVNPAGSLYDAEGKDKSWNSGAKVFTAVDATGWLAVVRVPLQAIGVKENELPTLWRVNLHRYRPARAGAPALDLAWSPTRSAQNHIPGRFGLVACHSGKRLDAAKQDAIIKELTMKAGIELGEPVIVAMAPADIRGWGPYQFPLLVRLPEGRIQLSFHAEADSVTAYGLPPVYAVSSDDGRTWKVLPRDTSGNGNSYSWYGPCLLANGDRLFPLTLRSRPVAEIALPAQPFARYVNYHMNCKVYRVEDLPPACADGYLFRRQAAGSAELREERARVRLPGEVRVVMMPEGLMWFPWLSTQFIVAPDGSLLAASFTLRRIADGRFPEKNPVVLLRSTDNGRSFDFWGEIPYLPDLAVDPKAADRLGFSEHWLQFMPDGSALCLLRTEDGLGQGPLYQSRSTDNGKTWSRPEVFDNLGVWPQMLTLKNGVTLSSYGRPGLYLRASEDSSGRRWSRRVEVVPAGKHMTDTCSYSALLPLSDDTALMAYSDFNVPGPDGTPRKTILVRTVKTAELTPQVAPRGPAPNPSPPSP